MQVAVVGCGYVGLVAAACLAELGHDIICVDTDREKITLLDRGEALIHEEYLPELLARHRGKRLFFSSDLEEAVRQSLIVIIAVGTPADESGDADLSPGDCCRGSDATDHRSGTARTYGEQCAG